MKGLDRKARSILNKWKKGVEGDYNPDFIEHGPKRTKAMQGLLKQALGIARQYNLPESNSEWMNLKAVADPRSQMGY